MNEERVRILAYLFLGMVFGVIIVSLCIDFHVSRETSPRETSTENVSRETSKKGETHESDSTGTE